MFDEKHNPRLARCTNAVAINPRVSLPRREHPWWVLWYGVLQDNTPVIMLVRLPKINHRVCAYLCVVDYIALFTYQRLFNGCVFLAYYVNPKKTPGVLLRGVGVSYLLQGWVAFCTVRYSRSCRSASVVVSMQEGVYHVTTGEALSSVDRLRNIVIGRFFVVVGR